MILHMVDAIGLLRPDYCKIQIFQFVFKIVVSTCFHNYSWKSSTKQNSFGQPACIKKLSTRQTNPLNADVGVLFAGMVIYQLCVLLNSLKLHIRHYFENETKLIKTIRSGQFCCLVFSSMLTNWNMISSDDRGRLIHE